MRHRINAHFTNPPVTHSYGEIPMSRLTFLIYRRIPTCRHLCRLRHRVVRPKLRSSHCFKTIHHLELGLQWPLPPAEIFLLHHAQYIFRIAPEPVKLLRLFLLPRKNEEVGQTFRSCWNNNDNNSSKVNRLVWINC